MNHGQLMAKDRFFNLKMYQGAYPSPTEGIHGQLAGGPASTGETETPLLDIYEDRDAIMIEVDLPGIDPSQIGVLLENSQVVIEGRRGERGEGQGAG
ncbi:MAG TPA: Hsp20 family protein, partial [Nitrospiria bacterium]